KRKLQKISMVVVAIVLFAGIMFINIEKNEHGQWEMGAVSSFAQGGESGGGVSGSWKDFWHPSSTIESQFAKLTPSPQVTHSVTAVGGWITIEGKKISVGGGVNNNSTYSISVTNYECSFSWTSPKCLQKEEYTIYIW